MDYESAKETCHVRSGIYRTGDPVKVFTQDDLKIIHPSLQDINKDRIGSTTPKVYWKNHSIAFDERVPDEDKTFDDWEEYDPRDQPECSAFNEMPAQSIEQRMMRVYTKFIPNQCGNSTETAPYTNTHTPSLTTIHVDIMNPLKRLKSLQKQIFDVTTM